MASNQFVLITGCGEGSIGHALARHFRVKGTSQSPDFERPFLQGQGYIVIATLLPHERREHLQAHKIHVFDADVTQEKHTSILKRRVEEITHGKLDILVNNAGICYTMTAADTDTSEVEKMFAVNVFGPMRMVHHFHRMLVAAKGTIVNIGSIGGIVPYVYGASYNASKAALHHYGNTLRVEMKPFGVRVVNVISGEVATNILLRDVKRKLPPDSLYLSMEEDFISHVQRSPKTITPDQYASGVVQEITKAVPRSWFWHGSNTFIVRWCDIFLPRTFWDWLFWRMFHFDKLVHSQTNI